MRWILIKEFLINMDQISHIYKGCDAFHDSCLVFRFTHHNSSLTIPLREEGEYEKLTSQLEMYIKPVVIECLK